MIGSVEMANGKTDWNGLERTKTDKRTVNMTQEEQNKRLVESLEQLSQAWRSMGQTADTLCESLGKLSKMCNNGGQ